jgi:hypothetical protein
MRGLPLWLAQIREAWILRSFTNWTGKAWGGGHYRGQFMLFSDKFSK